MEPLGPTWMSPQEIDALEWHFGRHWNGYLKLKGLIFLTMYAQTAAMDAQQATDLLGRTMDLSSAATTAARTANTMLQSFGGGGKGGPRFGDGAKVLRPPEFDTDDPVKVSNSSTGSPSATTAMPTSSKMWNSWRR